MKTAWLVRICHRCIKRVRENHEQKASNLMGGERHSKDGWKTHILNGDDGELRIIYFIRVCDFGASTRYGIPRPIRPPSRWLSGRFWLRELALRKVVRVIAICDWTYWLHMYEILSKRSKRANYLRGISLCAWRRTHLGELWCECTFRWLLEYGDLPGGTLTNKYTSANWLSHRRVRWDVFICSESANKLLRQIIYR